LNNKKTLFYLNVIEVSMFFIGWYTLEIIYY